MLARSAGKRVVILAVPFMVLGLYLAFAPPAALGAEGAGTVRAFAWLVVAITLVGAAFGVLLWAKGGDQVI